MFIQLTSRTGEKFSVNFNHIVRICDSYDGCHLDLLNNPECMIFCKESYQIVIGLINAQLPIDHTAWRLATGGKVIPK